MLPPWCILLGVLLPDNAGAKRPKWRLRPGIKDKYRVDAESILNYNWYCTFKYPPGAYQQYRM